MKRPDLVEDNNWQKSKKCPVSVVRWRACMQYLPAESARTQYAPFAPQCAGDCGTQVAPRKELELDLPCNMKISSLLTSL